MPDEKTQKELYVIHKSIMPLVIRFFEIELAAVILFLLTGWLVIFLRELFNMSTNGIVWELVFVLTIFQALITGVMLYLALLWAEEFYVLAPTNILTRQGVFTTRETSFNLSLVQEVEVKQGTMGRIFDFGEIIFADDPPMNQNNLKNIPRPYKYAEIIKKFNENLATISTESPKSNE